MNTVNFLLPQDRAFSPRNLMEAVSVICNDDQLQGLDARTLNAIHALIQSTRKKELGKVKPLACPFKLASLFMGKGETRAFLNYVYSDGKTLIGSDGWALVRIARACQEGYYDGLGAVQPHKGKYPGFERALVRIGPFLVPFLLSEGMPRARANGVNVVYPLDGGSVAFDEVYIRKIQSAGVNTWEVNAIGAVFKGNLADGTPFDGLVMPIRT